MKAGKKKKELVKKVDVLYVAERKRQRDAELEELALDAQQSWGDHSWYPEALAAIKEKYKDIEGE